MTERVESLSRRRKTIRRHDVSSSEPPTLDSLCQSVAVQLGQPSSSIALDDDLIGRGLDSLAILKQSIALRRQGIEIPFADLLAAPTLSNWWRLISASSNATSTDFPSPSGAAALNPFEPFDLSPMQRAYRIGRSDDQLFGSITPHYYVEIDGHDIDPDRLQKAMQAVIARHDMLRVRFLPDGRQQILSVSTWNGITVHDLRHATEEELETSEERMRRELSHLQLGVEDGQVFDLRLSLLPRNATRIHLNITMLVCDAHSFQTVLDDLRRCYETTDALLSPIQYSFPRYLAERASRNTAAFLKDHQYWRAQLPDMPGGPALPLSIVANSLKDLRTGQTSSILSAEKKQSLMKAAGRHNLSLAVSLITAFAESLARWTEDPRFLLNVPIFDRDEWDAAIGQLVGDFTNVILLDLDFTLPLPFAEQAARVKKRLIEHAAHTAYPGVEIIRDLSRSRPDQGLVAPVVFTSTIGMGELFGQEFQDTFGKPGWVSSETPQVWIDHQVTENEGGLVLRLEFLENLFPDGLISAFFETYIGVVEWLSHGDWGEPAPLPLTPRQCGVREKVNATEAPMPEGLLHSGFFKHAAACPERVALLWDDKSQLTYGELARDALAVASTIASLGVGQGAVVAVHAARGPHQIAAALGVLASGNILLPIGADQPQARLSTIVEKAVARVVLTDKALPPLHDGCRAILLEEALHAIPLDRPCFRTAEDTAYVIFTSGSTGAPKGVEIAHCAALNTIEDINERYTVTCGSRAFAISSLDFDLAIYDIFGMFSAGGSLVLIAEDERRDARHWLELVTKHGVNVWNSVPALLDMLLIAAEANATVLPLRLVLVSGDWVGLDLPGRVRRITCACRFIALGGATEASIWSNGFEVTEMSHLWKSIPYGFPLRNQKFRAVDRQGRDCPDWVPGELWIGGAGVAKGYLNDLSLTADRFVAWNGDRWYRTGDRGRYWPDGTLEFLCRTDLQVKVRGHRIELREIEAALEAHPQVEKGVVVIVTNPVAAVAAAVTSRGTPPGLHELQSFVAERLPAYMVPQRLLAMDAFPVTANGKVDRKAIELSFENQPVVEDEPAATDTEAAVAAVWNDLLHTAQVSRHDDFFSLGGDSLLATRLLEAINKHFGVRLRMRDFLISPTIIKMSARIEAISQLMEEGTI